MSATVEQLASQIQVLLDDAYRRGVQQGLRAAAEAVEQLIPSPDTGSPGWMRGRALRRSSVGMRMMQRRRFSRR